MWPGRVIFLGVVVAACLGCWSAAGASAVDPVVQSAAGTRGSWSSGDFAGASAWTPDGLHMVTVGENYFLLMDAVTGWIVDRVETRCAVRAVAADALAPGQSIACQTAGDRVGLANSGALSVSPDGAFVASEAHAAGGDPARRLGAVQFFNLRTLGVEGRVVGAPLLWIERASGPALIVGPSGPCAGPACALTLVDPATLATRPLGGAFAAVTPPSPERGQRTPPAPMIASPDRRTFITLSGVPGRALSLRAWSADSLAEAARFDLGASAIREIGFDRAGARVFARADDRLMIFDLTTKAEKVWALGPAMAAAQRGWGGAEVKMTDIDAHVLVTAPALISNFGSAPAIVDYVSGARKATLPGYPAALFPHHGVVLWTASGPLANQNGRASWLDMGSGAVSGLGDLFLGRKWFPPVWLPGFFVLSADGQRIYAAEGWWEPVGVPLSPARDKLWVTGYPPFHSWFASYNLSDVEVSRDGRRFAFHEDSPAPGAEYVLEFGKVGYRTYPGSGALNADLVDRLSDVPPGAPCPAHPQRADEPAGPDNPPTTSCYAWAALSDGALMIYSARNYATKGLRPLFTYYLRRNLSWLAQDPEYRFDNSAFSTSRTRDSDIIRWHIGSQPWLSLPAQTYMRDFYQPDLVAKLLACDAADNCGATLKAVPDPSGLNWVLPRITKISVLPGSSPDRAFVDVEATEGFDPAAPAGRRKSGLYDLRLYRDGKLVGQWPDPSSGAALAPGTGLAAESRAGNVDVTAWRAQSAVPDARGGVVSHRFDIALPTDAASAPRCAPATEGKLAAPVKLHGGRAPFGGVWRRPSPCAEFAASADAGPPKGVLFSAYAFNEARVKGGTVTAAPFKPAVPPTPRPRRAYVISIGVDAYPRAPNHNLTFSAADALTMTTALAKIQNYQVTTLALTARVGAPSQADKADIHAALDILAGRDPGAENAPAIAAIEAAGLRRATPDDVIILTFSGHGWADATGDFFLLPSDAVMKPDAFGPDTSSLISSADLTDWLRNVDAGEMAIIIDACHSAASVEADGFRPGPMGDPGLGQLAYDKGIRILAATQADSTALESAALHGGLLTFALAHDGLGLGGGKARAKTDGDGAVPLDALLRYALKDVPRIERRDASGHRNGALPGAAIPLLVPTDPGPPAPPVEQPSLFDFTGTASPAAIVPPGPAPMAAR